jgi:hypothetical protein
MRLSAKLALAYAFSVIPFATACGSGDDNGTFSVPEAGHEGAASEGGGTGGGSEAGTEAGSEAGTEGDSEAAETGAEAGPETGEEAGESADGGNG